MYRETLLLVEGLSYPYKIFSNAQLYIKNDSNVDKNRDYNLEFESLLSKSVENQMISDVPILQP